MIEAFQYADLVTFVAIIIGIFSAVVLVNNTVKAIKELTRPVSDLRLEIDKINERLDRVDEKLDNDYDMLEREKERNRLLLRSVRQLLVHEIDGNDVKGLNTLKDEIDDYLFKNA